jgi:hypothetical protein
MYLKSDLYAASTAGTCCYTTHLPNPTNAANFAVISSRNCMLLRSLLSGLPRPNHVAGRQDTAQVWMPTGNRCCAARHACWHCAHFQRNRIPRILGALTQSGQQHAAHAVSAVVQPWHGSLVQLQVSGQSNAAQCTMSRGSSLCMQTFCG